MAAGCLSSDAVHRPRRSLADEAGQSLVELALALPLLAFSLIGGADLARAFAHQLAVQNGARAGAESYAIDASPTADEAVIVARNEMARTPGLDADAATITVLKARADGSTPCASPPSVATPCFVTVRVRYDFNTVTTWPLLPNSATFDRTTTVRTFY